MVIVGVIDMDLHPAAQLADVLVEGRLEPHVAQDAAAQPLRRQRLHLRDHRPRVDIRRPEQLQRSCRPPPFRQGRAFQHHRARIGARHRQVRRIRAGIDPRPVQQRPAEARTRLGRPALHLHHPIIHIQLELVDEPQAQFAHRHAVAHWHRPGPDEAFPAGIQRQPLHRPSRRIGPVQHPDRLAVFRRRLQHVQKGGHIGVDAAAQVLQIDQQHVEFGHPFVARPPHLAVQAEYREAVHRIAIIRALHHIVLQIALHPVLRAKGGGQPDFGTGGQGVHRMCQILRHRRRMRQQGHASPLQLRPQSVVGQKAVEAEVHVRSRANESG